MKQTNARQPAMVKRDQPSINSELREDDRSLFEQALQAKMPAEMGQALEQLVEKLLRSVEGLEVQATAREPDEHETDFVVWNAATSVPVRSVGNILFVECKSLAKPLQANHVAEFAAKLRERGLSTGLLFALPEASLEARKMVSLLQQDRIRILLFDRFDLERVAAGEEFRDVLEEKLLSPLLSVN